MAETHEAAIPQSTSPVSHGSNEDRLRLSRPPTGFLDFPSFAKSGKLVVEYYISWALLCQSHTAQSEAADQHQLLRRTLGHGDTRRRLPLSIVVLSPPSLDTINYKHFAPSTITTFAAISSILFVFTVLVSQGCAQIFRFEQISIAEGVDNEEPLVLWSLTGLSLFLQVQVLCAFLFLELVLAAYEPLVGWVGIALTACLGVVALGLWGLQATGRKPVARYRRLASPRKRRASGGRKEGA